MLLHQEGLRMAQNSLSISPEGSGHPGDQPQRPRNPQGIRLRTPQGAVAKVQDPLGISPERSGRLETSTPEHRPHSALSRGAGPRPACSRSPAASPTPTAPSARSAP